MLAQQHGRAPVASSPLQQPQQARQQPPLSGAPGGEQPPMAPGQQLGQVRGAPPRGLPSALVRGLESADGALTEDCSALVDFLVQRKDGDLAKAEDFLRRCLEIVKAQKPDTRGGPAAAATTDSRFDLFEGFHGDFTDSKPATLVLVVNGQLAVVGHLIGKGGSAISKLEKEGNVRIRVEDPQPGSSERRVYVNGALANCTYVQQLITKRVNEKLRQEGIHQDLIKIFLPQETISHVIGKGGSNIKRVERESGARVKIWHEQTLMADSAVGKVMVIHGLNHQRTMAQYLILRQVTNLSTSANRHPESKKSSQDGDFPTTVPSDFDQAAASGQAPASAAVAQSQQWGPISGDDQPWSNNPTANPVDWDAGSTFRPFAGGAGDTPASSDHPGPGLASEMFLGAFNNPPHQHHQQPQGPHTGGPSPVLLGEYMNPGNGYVPAFPGYPNPSDSLS